MVAMEIFVTMATGQVIDIYVILLHRKPRFCIMKLPTQPDHFH